MTYSTISTNGNGGNVGSPTTAFWTDAQGVLWAGFTTLPGAGKVAYSNDSGSTWTTKDLSADLGITDFNTGFLVYAVVSGNMLLVIYNAAAADIKVKRFTITRGGGGTVSSLADAKQTTTIVGINDLNADLFCVEFATGELIIGWADLAGAFKLSFARVKISGTAFSDLSGAASAVTTVTPATATNSMGIKIHPSSGDLYVFQETPLSTIVEYRFAASGSNWSNSSSSKILAGTAGSVFGLVKDTFRGRVMVVYGTTGTIFWSYWNSSNSQTSGSITGAGVTFQTFCAVFASNGNITIKIGGLNNTTSALQYETYAVTNNQNDIVLLYAANTPLHLFSRTFDGTSWSAATDLGALDGTKGPNHLVAQTQFLPESGLSPSIISLFFQRMFGPLPDIIRRLN